MKVLIFLVILAAVVSVGIWKMRQTQAKEELARLEAHRRRQKAHKEAVTSEEDMIWPVIIRPVKGKPPAGETPELDYLEVEEVIEEPSMTAIEYESPKEAS